MGIEQSSLNNKECPICSAQMNVHLRDVKDIHYNIKGKFNIYRCSSCGFQMLDQNNGAISEIYEEDDYYAYEDLSNEGIFWRLSKYWMMKNNGYDITGFKLSLKEKLAYIFFLPHFRNHLWWMPPYSEKQKSFIDIGCGSGKVVKLLKGLGYDAYGTDVSSYGGEVGQEEDLKIIVGDFLEADIPQKHFDYLYTRHALEHINEPNKTFEKLTGLLSDDGVGFISVPNVDSITSKIFGRYWYFLGAPLHVVNYTPKSISKILEKNGMQVLKIKASADYIAILGSIQAFLNRNNDKKSDEGFVANSSVLKGLAQLISYFGTIINQGSHLQVQFKRLEK